MTISLAIPTYNSSQYLWDCIRPVIDSDIISEIVIHDDRSSDVEYFNLIETIGNIDTNKIKLYRGSKNEKAYINKYLAVSKCKNDWVYLIDSDNWFDKSILDVIRNIDFSKEDTCYHVKQLHMTNGNIVKFDYANNFIDLSIAKKNIREGTNYIDWLLNTGNFIVNKNSYIDSQQSAVQSLRRGGKKFKDPKGADVLLFSYCWFRYKNTFTIVDGFYHHHRIRPGNYFVQELDYNMQLTKEYMNNILEL